MICVNVHIKTYRRVRGGIVAHWATLHEKEPKGKTMTTFIEVKTKTQEIMGQMAEVSEALKTSRISESQAKAQLGEAQKIYAKASAQSGQLEAVYQHLERQLSIYDASARWSLNAHYLGDDDVMVSAPEIQEVEEETVEVLEDIPESETEEISEDAPYDSEVSDD